MSAKSIQSALVEEPATKMTAVRTSCKCACPCRRQPNGLNSATAQRLRNKAAATKKRKQAQADARASTASSPSSSSDGQCSSTSPAVAVSLDTSISDSESDDDDVTSSSSGPSPSRLKQRHHSNCRRKIRTNGAGHRCQRQQMVAEVVISVEIGQGCQCKERLCSHRLEQITANAVDSVKKKLELAGLLAAVAKIAIPDSIQ